MVQKVAVETMAEAATRSWFPAPFRLSKMVEYCETIIGDWSSSSDR